MTTTLDITPPSGVQEGDTLISSEHPGAWWRMENGEWVRHDKPKSKRQRPRRSAGSRKKGG